jgi:cation diffusion facilitator family transporter
MSGESKKVVIAALSGNLCIAATKFAAAMLTGSSAMLSEGIHSVVDTGNQVLMLYGLKRSKAPPDRLFPFGHAREIYFWSFVVAILIFAGGAGLSAYEGIAHLLSPGPLEDPHLNYIVLGAAALFEGASWTYGMREFSRKKGKQNLVTAIHRGKDPDMFVVIFEDSAALLGLAVAFLGVFLSHLTGSHYYDGAASLIIGLILAATASWLAYETKGLLIGESAALPVVEGIRAIAVGYPAMRKVNEVLTLHMGPDSVLVNLSVDFADEVPAGEVETAICRLTRRIKREYPLVRRVFVEVATCQPPEEDAGQGLPEDGGDPGAEP